MVDVTVSSLSARLTFTAGVSHVFALFNLCLVCTFKCFNFPASYEMSPVCVLQIVPDIVLYSRHTIQAESTGLNTDFKHLDTTVWGEKASCKYDLF